MHVLYVMAHMRSVNKWELLCFQSKLKKIKEKYADQDEEERQIRMEILAVGPGLFTFCSRQLVFTCTLVMQFMYGTND